MNFNTSRRILMKNSLKTLKTIICALLSLTLMLSPAGCASAGNTSENKNGKIMILYTSDVHCGIDSRFGYVGLKSIRDTLEAEGYTTILVDNGDAIQGEPVGTLTKGRAVIDLMNALEYDVAIPGNHEFDYGMESFLELTKSASFPYVSCNFNKNGELVFKPYVIKEAAGKKIAFVGVTTPCTLTNSTPGYFQDGNGNFIYGFMQDTTGEAVYKAVQSAVDSARAEGAEYVYVLGHCGLEDECRPWTYADIIGNTTGIDVFLDGHSHDIEQITMKNKEGKAVVRSACGAKFAAIGYSRILEDGTIETGIQKWTDGVLDGVFYHEEPVITELVNNIKTSLDSKLAEVVATSSVSLTIYDPNEKAPSGDPVRMVRRAETNLGDLCADALRAAGKADVAVMNGGGIRKDINPGDVTYGDIINVFPFGNLLCVMEVTGQQILDALEWSVRSLPEENGGFLQVSGMTFEIDADLPDSPCISDEYGLFVGIGAGKRRIKNVRISGLPIDPQKKYTLAGINYTLLEHGDGYTVFDGAALLQDSVRLDNQLLIDYITETLNGVIGAGYEDPYGSGRIVFTPSAP